MQAEDFDSYVELAVCIIARMMRTKIVSSPLDEMAVVFYGTVSRVAGWGHSNPVSEASNGCLVS